jgi:hypothetical protein
MFWDPSDKQNGRNYGIEIIRGTAGFVGDLDSLILFPVTPQGGRGVNRSIAKPIALLR